MTRGRPPATAMAEPAPIIDAEAVRSALDAQDQLAVMAGQAESRVRLIAHQIGYQLPADCTDPDLIQRDIAANMRRSVEACLEVGRGLLILKEACPHGNFLARLDVLGVDKRLAQRFMQAVFKFSKAASTPLLSAAGNQTKLFEMLVLDDEQIEELALTGQTGELTLDDVATMSVKELRAALRTAKADAQATEQLLADKNRKIDELAREAGREQPLPRWDERFAGLNTEVGAIGNLTDECLGKHLLFIEAAEALMQQLPPETAGAGKSCIHRIGEQIARICTLAATLRAEYDTRLEGYVALDKTNVLED